MQEEKIELDISTLLPGVDSEEDDCIQRLQNALLLQEGIQQVHHTQNPAKIDLCLHYDPSAFSELEIQKLVQKTSSKITKRYHHLTLSIEGMDCSDCALVLEHGFSRIKGILTASASYIDQELWVEYDRQQISRNSIHQHVRNMGYDVPKSNIVRFLHENQAILLSLLSGLFLVLGWIGEQWLNLPDLAITITYLLSYAFGGYPLLHHSYHHLFHERRFNTDQLMLAAAIGAAILGHWSEGALLLFLFSLGHALEGRAMARARNDILALAEIAPRTARVLTEAGEEILPIEEIRIGDLVLIPPGARIPIDGIILSGQSSIDQSSITGESLPVDVSERDQVFAGSINGEGALEVQATRLAQDSTLARVVQMVQEAQAQQSPSEQVSQRITRILVPTVFVTALIIMLIPPLFGVPFEESFLLAMTLLVAASPCALALGTPSAILAGVARAARSGVLIKGGAHLENMGNLQAMAFDKTGTLTYGKPHVTDVIAIAPYSETDVLKYAAGVESRSAHPLAQAILKAAQDRRIEIHAPQSAKSETGRGIQAIMDERVVWVGKVDTTEGEELSLPSDLKPTIDSLENQGKTIVNVAIDSRIIGIIAIADQIRPEAKGTIASLKTAGIRHMLMLTGDSSQSAAQFAAQVGLEEYQASLLPEEKLDMLNELTAEYKTIAMVGDGVNDAPALAHATVGIAMGGAKTQVALETADVVLMADDLSKLPFAIGLGQSTSSIIKQNFVIALSVIAGLIILTLFNMAGIGFAVLLHEGSTILVVFNSLRLLRYRHDEALQ